jgi:hypothetical protein
MRARFAKVRFATAAGFAQDRGTALIQQRRSVVRAFEILKAFQYPGEWVRACDLSRRSGIPEATVTGIMATLESVGAVIRDGRGQYQCALLSVAEFNDALFNNPHLASPKARQDAGDNARVQ